MNNQVLVTGANGFTGRFVCLELSKRGIPFVALLRNKSQSSWMRERNFLCKYADINNFFELKEAMKGCDILLNVASLGFGSSKTIIKACKASFIKRAIFVSTTAIFTRLNAKSKKVRTKAENDIKNSNLDWTILRPTMIFGTPADRNIIKLIKYLDKMPFIPVFGNGRFLQQPVFVKDVAWSIVEVINNKKTYKSEFNISGKKAITFNNLIDQVSIGLSKSRLKIHIPLFAIIFIFKIAEFLKLSLPIKSEQINRLNENKNFSYSFAKQIFNYQPTSLKDAINYEIELYKNHKNN